MMGDGKGGQVMTRRKRKMSDDDEEEDGGGVFKTTVLGSYSFG